MSRTVTVARRRFALDRRSVEAALDGVLPDPIVAHYVVVGNRRYPPKQALAAATGLDRADFATHQARRIMMNLGFPVGRREAPAGTHEGRSGTADGPDYAGVAGQWVAVAGNEILVAATSPQAVVGWLAAHDRRADTMFRVPEDEVAATGLAPL